MMTGGLFVLAAAVSSTANPALDGALVSYFQCMDNAGIALEPSKEPAEIVAKAASFRCKRELNSAVNIQKDDFISRSPTKELVIEKGEYAISPWILSTTKKIEDWGIERAVAAVVETRAKRFSKP